MLRASLLVLVPATLLAGAAQAQTSCAASPAELAVAVVTAPAPALAPAQRKVFDAAVAALKARDSQEAARQFQLLSSAYFSRANANTACGLMLAALRLGSVESDPKVLAGTRAVARARLRVDSLQRVLAAQAAQRRELRARRISKAAPDATLDNALKDIEAKMDALGDDSQLANVDMQSALQVQQQTLQMISTISKMIWDTEMAVIRKIGG